VATTIKLGKKKHKVRFNFQALADAEAAARIDLMRRGPGDLNVREFSAFVWAVIEPDKDGGKPTLDDVRNELGPHNIKQIQHTLLDAWTDAYPPPEFDDNKAQRAWERLKVYFRTDPTKWKSDMRGNIFADMRAQIDALEAAIGAMPDEDETAEGNAAGQAGTN
jgi:hypothetical protein